MNTGIEMVIRQVIILLEIFQLFDGRYVPAAILALLHWKFGIPNGADTIFLFHRYDIDRADI